MDFIISASTDVGIRRAVNQDSLFVRKLHTAIGKMVFAVLCDGMGGLKYGEVASAVLIDAFTDWMYIYLPKLSQRQLEDYIIREQWIAVINAQNSRIREFGMQNNCSVGSTITALLLTENRYFLLNIGDSRAYEIADQVVQLTYDHTVVANEVRLGNLTPEQAELAPGQNILTKCVGVAESVYPDMFFGDTKRNAVYMLCSDGFRHKISAEEMRGYLLSEGYQSISAMKKEEYLIELNKQRGETDNISVITIYTK